MKHLVQLIVIAGVLGVGSVAASAQEVRLEGLSFYSEVSQRHVMAARVWALQDEGQTAWAGARVDWRSLSLTPVLGLSHRVASGRRYALLLRTEAEALVIAPPQGALGLGLGMGLINQWQWRRIEMHLGARGRARVTLEQPAQATRTLTGVWTLSRRIKGRHSIGLGVEAGQVRASSGSALMGVAQLSYGF